MLFSANFIPIYFSTTISISLLTALLILVSGLRQKLPGLLALAGLCLLLVVYQYATLNYHSSHDVNEAVFWLKIQTSASLFAMSTYFYAFATLAKHPKAVLGTYFFIALSIVLLLINSFAEYSLRFTSIDELKVMQIWTGESITLLTGKFALTGLLAHATGLCMLLALLVIVKRLYQTQQRQLAMLLLAAVFLQLVAVGVGYAIDIGRLAFVYIAALPMMFMNVGICVFGAFSIRSQTSLMSKLNFKTQQLERSFSELAKVANQSASDDFYYQMLKSLYDITGCAYIFIGLTENSDTTEKKVTTKIFVADGEVAENFSYSLADTPCEKVLNNKTCIYTSDVTQIFPKDRLLVDMHVQSYIGIPLIGENDELIGLLTLLDPKPIAPSPQLLEAIQVFAARASAEIRRDKVETKLRTMAYVDYTTGLANKARLFEVVNETFSRRETDKHDALLMLIDIDRFTNINRDLGYDAGEQVLREIGNRLMQYQTGDIFFARNGGDEFAVVFPRIGVQPTAFMNVQWEALRAILRRPVQIGAQLVSLDFSMGAVIFPQQTGRKYDVVQCAESALSQSKSKGRGCASLFEPELLEVLERRQYIDHQLRIALKTPGQLSLVYQPKTDQNGTLIGAEALLRWQHKTLGFVSPAEFIPIAELSDLIIDVGDWVIEHVCIQLSKWQKDNFNCKVAINMSPVQLLKTDFVDFLFSQLENYQISPNLIELEITESGLLNDINNAVQVLKKIQAKGITIALDDFGTGYSSLSYLRELPLNVLKIDKSFVDKINDESSAELIKTIIGIAHHLSIDIIAEGTESIEQVELLIKMGCEGFQGYYFSRPLPASELPLWHFKTTS
ncbi:sensor domain-containing phosphodiesterase [Paraglaciecola sp. 25GB23A]|uniref:bifunctional diguanylate cyclase/phosphodiesterase n=1 Tax=Paraglaciecola sp. 25GB23A TaxID=3156068 RepID=UPI0032AF28D4